MPMYFPPWDTDTEPTEAGIKTWMDNLYGKFEPIEQSRWNQGNIDTLFYAGEQRFINSYFNFYPQYNFQQFHFNFLQQPVNMVTGYQRQHRKAIQYLPVEGSKQEHADDLTKLESYANTYRQRLEKFSMGCEQSSISGLVLLQPYLDFTDDPINGTLDLKLWSYNSFMIDPYFREPDMSDCNFVWCQQYISKGEAINYFPHKADLIRSMSGYGNRYGKFYFLPENYNLARNDLLVLSHVWYKSKRRKKMLYNTSDGIVYDYPHQDKHMDELVRSTGTFEVIEVDTPTWKVAVVVNEQLMYMNYNPLGFDECPFVPMYWNYDPHIAQYDLRVRSLVRSMRDAQFLLNRRVILNHDISESSINSGYYRVENAIVNEEELRYAGQGKDIIIKEGNQIQEVIQKIVPNAVPPSDMQLADQLVDFIFRVSGVNQELLGMASDANTGIEVLLRQGAGLVTLQKYYDQWDVALKLIGRIDKCIMQNKWSAAKVAKILGKEPGIEWQTRTFSKYDVVVAEGQDTAIQQQMAFKQMLDLNQLLGGIIPPKFILQHATVQDKNEIIQEIENREQQASEMAKQTQLLEQSKIEAELQALYARSASELASARERHGRAESNIGLFEERLSEISQNRSMALKNKVEALEKLIGLFQMTGEGEVKKAEGELEDDKSDIKRGEDVEKLDAKLISKSNEFLQEMMQKNPSTNMMGQEDLKLKESLL